MIFRSAILFGAVTLLLADVARGQQGLPQIDSLVSALASGGARTRERLSEVVRQSSFGDETGHRDAPAARAVARGALVLAGHISDPDVVLSGTEREWRSTIVRALWQAIDLEPTDTWSLERLEELAPYPHLWQSPQKELAALTKALSMDAKLSPSLVRTTIHLDIELGLVDSADAVLHTHVGASTALREHLLAEVSFARGEDSAGTAHYYAGASAIRTAEEAAEYGLELRWIAEPGEVKEWEALPLNESRQTWLRGFWGKRDLDDIQLPGTRLPEQFRRWRKALASYRWNVDGSTVLGLDIPPAAANEKNVDDILFPPVLHQSELGRENMLLPRSRVLDDRGRLTMKLGVPQTVNLPGITAVSEENLYWLTPGGRLVVGFSKPALPFDPNHVGLDRWGMIARNHPTGDLTTTCAVDSKLCSLAGLIAVNHGNWRNLGVQISAGQSLTRYTGMREVAEKSDLNADTFRDSLGATVQAYGILGGGVLVVVAIPLDRLQRASGPSADHLAARVRVVVGNQATGESAAAIDTLRVWRAPVNAAPGALVSSYLVLPVPTGSWSVATIVSDEGKTFGSGVRNNAVPVPPKGGGQLVLGDPIIGRAGSGLSWQHNGESIPLNPTNAWRRDELALLTYEVDGQVVGRSYETRYELWKATGKPKAPTIVITSKIVARAVGETVHRELALKELEPGTYRLVIRVKDVVSGQESVRERMIPVRK